MGRTQLWHVIAVLSWCQWCTPPGLLRRGDDGEGGGVKIVMLVKMRVMVKMANFG